ncbi:MAG TPA: hypothetical protein VMV81_01210 [Phycisphaerae bacterium]|nr:hypothetical protein [Phycisphaerae bacterium]
MSDMQPKENASTNITGLRRLQAALLLPAIALIWIPGAALFYALFFILLVSLVLELIIQSRTPAEPPATTQKTGPRRRG